MKSPRQKHLRLVMLWWQGGLHWQELNGAIMMRGGATGIHGTYTKTTVGHE